MFKYMSFLSRPLIYSCLFRAHVFKYCCSNGCHWRLDHLSISCYSELCCQELLSSWLCCFYCSVAVLGYFFLFIVRLRLWISLFCITVIVCMAAVLTPHVHYRCAVCLCAYVCLRNTLPLRRNYTRTLSWVSVEIFSCTVRRPCRL